MPGLPPEVVVWEVGPRDGLQNEPGLVPTEAKCELVERLVDAGLPVVEVTSFVRPEWVPQLADAARCSPACSAGTPCATPSWSQRTGAGTGAGLRRP